MKQEKQMELRSEKVRNIIGQVPPVLLRCGIMIISVSLLVLVGISAFIPYQPGIAIEINVTQTKNGTFQYSTHIPLSAMKNRAKFTEVRLNSPTELPLSARLKIDSISDIIEVSGMNAWQAAALIPMEQISENILLEKPTHVSGKILFEKQSVMKWMVGKVLE